MTTPQSPNRGGDAVDNLVRDINGRYDISLPIRGVTWSPSKTRGSRGPGDEIVNRLRFLFYADKERLQKLLDTFDMKAKEICTEWEHKPSAEPDALLCQETSRSSLRSQWPGSSTAPNRIIADQVTATLARLLDESTTHVKASKESRLPANSLANPAINSPSRAILVTQENELHVREILGTRTRRRLFSRDKSLSEPTKSTSNMSSDDFPFEHETLMVQLPAQSVLENTSSRNPPLLSLPRHRQSYQTLLDQQLDVVTSPPNGGHISRKRSFQGPEERPRETSANRLIRYNTSQNANRGTHGNPFATSLDAPDIYNHAPMPRSNNSFCTYSTENTSVNTSFTESFGPSTDRTEYDSQDMKMQDSSVQPDLDQRYDPTPITQGFDDIPRPEKKNKPEALATTVVLGSRREILTEKALGEQSSNRNTNTVKATLRSRLYDMSPFAPFQCTTRISSLPFRQIYEIIRVSQASGVALQEFCTIFKGQYNEYDVFWSEMSDLVKQHKSVMPERSQTATWERAGTNFEEVALSGKVTFSASQDTPLFKFQLNPLKRDRGYRLARKFGSDRFLIVSFPLIRQDKLPTVLKNHFVEARLGIIQWLVRETHQLLGRQWRAFLVKPSEKSKKARTDNTIDAQDVRFNVFMFATDGEGFHSANHTGELDPRKTAHKAMEIWSLLNWFMPIEDNKEQPALKLFSRLNLAVSGTYKTVEFEASEVVATSDSYASNPHHRSLEDDKKISSRPAGILSGKVMNDGCSRMSQAAARKVAWFLGLDYVPSSYQARIGSAKGMWMPALSHEEVDQKTTTRDYWIETTDSQTKFQSHGYEGYGEDPMRITFEVVQCASRLRPASLNFQLIPILNSRGVPYDVFARLLVEDLKQKREDLDRVVQNPITLSKWIQDTNPVAKDRIMFKGIEFRGGLPSSLSESIIFLLEKGFVPQDCAFLRKRLFKVLETYCLRLENLMHIKVSRSAYAPMIADPLAVLNEGEVHLGFSEKFVDAMSGRTYFFLHDLDVLVARSPALLPSDVQKVRAVFDLRLQEYRDVIVFSSKGSCPLAEKLSGGDYDGDEAWVCWDDTVVKPFTNYENPSDAHNLPKMPTDDDLGIEIDRTIVSDLLENGDFSNNFLEHGFEFLMQENMLGKCSSYRESLCYHGRQISDPAAIELGYLAGRLVDRAKAGILFDEIKWGAFLLRRRLPARLGPPAYKDRGTARPTNHLIDRLVFQVAANQRSEVLAKYTEDFKNAVTFDPELTCMANFEDDGAQADAQHKVLLDNLKEKLGYLHKRWQSIVASFLGGEERMRQSKSRKGDTDSLAHGVEILRQEFLDIQPHGNLRCAFSTRWEREQCWKHNERKDFGHGLTDYWNLLKASMLFKKYHLSDFVWHVAGKELGLLKLAAKGPDSYCSLTCEIHDASKIDSRMAKQAATNMGLNVPMEFDDDAFEEEDIEWDEVQDSCG